MSHSHSPQDAILADDPALFEAAFLEPTLLFCCWLWAPPATGGASGALVDTGKPWSS